MVEICKKCGSEMRWIDCGYCEDGHTHHECGDDTCACLNPENNVPCETCDGESGWYSCINGCHLKKEV